MYTIERKCNFLAHTHTHSSKGTKYEHVEEIFMSFENVRKMKEFFEYFCTFQNATNCVK